MSKHVLFGQSISFSSAQDRYMHLMMARMKASDIVETEFQKWYRSCGSLNKVLDGCEMEADRLIGKYVDGQLYNQLLELGIYDIGKNAHHVQCINLSDLRSVIGKLGRMLKSIDEKKDAEAEYRELRKQCRGKVSGGGFGLRGALSGMFVAGTINAVTGAGHTVANTIGNIGSSISAASSKSALYQNDDTCELLTETILDCLVGAFVAHADIIRMRKPDCIDISFSNYERSNALLENALRLPEKAPELLVESFRALPIYWPLLHFIFLQYRSERRNVLNIAKYYGIDLSSLVNEVLSDEYAPDAKNDEEKALAAKARILALMEEMGIQESDVLNTLECDCLDRLVSGYVLEDCPSNTTILEQFRQYDAQRNNKQVIIKKHLIWQLGAEYHVKFTPEEIETVIAPEYTQEVKASTPAAESAKKQILYKMSVMGAQQSATLDQLESDCIARLCTNYIHADEKTCDAMLEKIKEYPAQERVKEPFIKNIQGRIEAIWAAEDGEIFDNLYLKTDISDQKQLDAAIAYVKEKGRTASSKQYLDAFSSCNQKNFKKAKFYAEWNLVMKIIAAILFAVPLIELVFLDGEISLWIFIILAGAAILALHGQLRKIWRTLTISGTIFHPQIFGSFNAKERGHLGIIQIGLIVTLCLAAILILSRSIARKHIAADTPTMTKTIDASVSASSYNSSATSESSPQMDAISESNPSAVSPEPHESSDSSIYKGDSYTDILDEVERSFPAAAYTLFDMDGDNNPEMIVKSGASQTTARYDIYSMQNSRTSYLGSLDAAYTELCPVSSYHALLAVKKYNEQETLSLVVYQNGELTSIEAYSGSQSNVLYSFDPLEFTAIRKKDSIQWDGSPSTMNDWSFEQFLQENWTYNKIDELSDDSRYELNFKASMMAQFGISALQSERLDRLLFLAAGYTAAYDPTSMDTFRKDDSQLVQTMSVATANNILLDLFGLQPDYYMLDETHGVFLSDDMLYFTESVSAFYPYIAIAKSVAENPEDRRYDTVEYDIYSVDQSYDYYDYEQFYYMTASEAASQSALSLIATATEQVYALEEGDARYQTCWIRDFTVMSTQ